MTAQPIDWVAKALADGYVCNLGNLGQLSELDRRRLDKAAKDGVLVKTRGRWPWIIWGTGPERDFWVAPERAAQLGIVA